MKNFLLCMCWANLISVLVNERVEAQSLRVEYSFTNGTHDDSGNGNDGTLYYFAHVVNSFGGKLQLPLDSLSKMKIPASVLNGLTDFTVKMSVVFTNVHTGTGSRNNIMSGSNSECFNCFAIAYVKDENAWEVDINGTPYLFPDSSITAHRGGHRQIRVVRQSGMIYFLTNNFLLGTAFNNSPLYVTTLLVGQKQNCDMGCWHKNECTDGFLDAIKIYDGAVFKETDEQTAESSLSVFPNPFSSSATISFSLQQTSHTTITLLDVAGRKIKTLLDENLGEGNHEVNLSVRSPSDNRESLGAGIYFLQLQTSSSTVTKKIVVE